MELKDIEKQTKLTRKQVIIQTILFELMEEALPQDRDGMFDKLIEKLTEQKEKNEKYVFQSDYSSDISKIKKILEEN